MDIYTLGPEGTFSNQAAAKVAEGKDLNIIYTKTIPKIAQSVESNPTSIGVVPIENSVGGIVGPAQDSLIAHRVEIIDELSIQTKFSLIGNASMDKISMVYSHPQAFQQTMKFVSQNLVNAEFQFTESNILSGEEFLDSKQKNVGAIIPANIAAEKEKFKNYLLEENIQDYEDNFTRFLVLKHNEIEPKIDTSKWKTSVYVEFHEDRHSLLFELLREFHVFDVNLCRLESRPSKSSPWSYVFFIDFYNNHRCDKCLKEIEKMKIKYRILGSYNKIGQS